MNTLLILIISLFIVTFFVTTVVTQEWFDRASVVPAKKPLLAIAITFVLMFCIFVTYDIATYPKELHLDAAKYTITTDTTTTCVNNKCDTSYIYKIERKK